MSTYSIHSPISSRRAGESSLTLRSSTVVVIAVCVVVALIAIAFMAAATTSSTQVKHLGHAAAFTGSGETVVVASTGAAPVAAAKAPTPVRPWRETLHGRAIAISRSAAPALSNPVAAGQ